MKNYFIKNEILELFLKNGTINTEDAKRLMVRKEIFENHPYKIYKGSDGRWRTYVKDEEKGRRLIVKKTYDEIIDYLNYIYIKVETIRTLYPEWLEFKSHHTNARTYIRRIKNVWDKYYKNDEIVDIPLKDITDVQCDIWAHKLIKDNNLTKKAYYNNTLIIRQLLDYAVQTGRIISNPFSFFSVNKRMFKQELKKNGADEVYLISQEKMLKRYSWKQFYNKRHKKQPLVPLAILFQLQTGIRLGELRAITWEDVENNYININKFIREEPGEIVYHTKGTYGDRKVPLTDEAHKILETAKLYSCSGFIFSVTDKPLSSSAIDKAYYLYCDELGFIRKSSHKARKTVISSLIDSGMNIDTVRRIAGHTDERTTYRSYCYGRLDDDSNLELMNNALK